MQIVKELALGLVTCVLILGLAVASNALLDRYLAGPDKQAAAQDGPDKHPTPEGGAPCVDAKGSWKNWPWPNVPTLSPPCAAAPESSQPTEKQ
jgi:hypothetical protein